MIASGRPLRVGVHARWGSGCPSCVAGTIARTWGGSSRDLDSWTIVYMDHVVVGASHFDGLVGEAASNSFGGGTVDVHVYTGLACLESSVLAHELGHAVIGDDRHKGSRWNSTSFWTDVGAELKAAIPPNDSYCALHLSEPTGHGVFH